MAKPRDTAEIRVNRRTLWIADRLYQLSNIAGVEIVEYKRDHGEREVGGVTGLQRRLALTAAAWLLLTILIIWLTSANTFLLSVAAILSVAVASRYVYILVRLKTRRTYYALLLFVGARVFALSTTDRGPLDELQGLIADVIENPPEHELRQTITAQNLILGDQVNIDNSPYSTGKVVNG